MSVWAETKVEALRMHTRICKRKNEVPSNLDLLRRVIRALIPSIGDRTRVSNLNMTIDYSCEVERAAERVVCDVPTV